MGQTPSKRRRMGREAYAYGLSLALDTTYNYSPSKRHDFEEGWREAEAREEATRAQSPKLRITLYDGFGNITKDEEIDAPTCTEEEMDEMVRLIESGCRADEAAAMVMHK